MPLRHPVGRAISRKIFRLPGLLAPHLKGGRSGPGSRINRLYVGTPTNRVGMCATCVSLMQQRAGELLGWILAVPRALVRGRRPCLVVLPSL